jgi:hypothetical protein
MKAYASGFAILPPALVPAGVGEPNDLFCVRSTQKAAEQIVAAIKEYIDRKKNGFALQISTSRIAR